MDDARLEPDVLERMLQHAFGFMPALADVPRDQLPEADRKTTWPRVLESLMRWKSGVRNKDHSVAISKASAFSSAP